MNSENFSKIKNAVNAASEFLNGELAKSYGSYKGKVELFLEEVGNLVIVDVVNHINGLHVKRWATIDSVDLVVMHPDNLFDIRGTVDDLFDETAVIRWNFNVK